MKLFELLENIECVYSDLNPQTDIADVTTFPENCTENSLLIIPNSSKIPTLLFSRPRAILCDTDAVIPHEVPTIRVKNTRSAMAYIYSTHSAIDYSTSKFVGITGTNGKTSTATFIKHAAAECGLRVGFIGTGIIESNGVRLEDRYYSMTTPDPWVLYPAIKRMQEDGCDLIVMEVSSHALELDKVAPIEFDYGIFTNLTAEHQDFHLDMESYYLAKKRLFDACRVAIINIDDSYGRRLSRECKCEVITSGVLWRGDVYADNIESFGQDGVSYLYHGRDFCFITRLHTAGLHNIYNSMLAITACKALGLKPYKIKNALSRIKTINGRYEIIKDYITVIIDYAHTDYAMETVLRDARANIVGCGCFTVVFGCGGERDRSKRARMARIAEKYCDLAIVTTDNSRKEDPQCIIDDIVKGFNKDHFKITVNRQQAIREAILQAKDGDTVAIIGKGAETYNIDKDGYHPFDEKAIIKDALEQRRRIE